LEQRKTQENRYKIVETKNLYKEITERERTVWQDKNMDNKGLLKKNDAQQLWNEIRRLIEFKKQRK
jgi:hypothetical protein